VLDFAAQHSIEVVPLLSASAAASAGPMRGGVRDHPRRAAGASAAGGPLDGVALYSMAQWSQRATKTPPVRFARIPGRAWPGSPPGGTLDLHANVTQTMVDHATALVGYHTAPHVTRRRPRSGAWRSWRGPSWGASGCERPAPAADAPAGETAVTTHGGYAEVMAQAEDLVRQTDLVDASVFSVQPWLDVLDVAAACSWSPTALPIWRRSSGPAAGEFWSRRHTFEVQLTPTHEAIRRALASEAHPFILADSADAPSSGAPGDSTAVLEALLAVSPPETATSTS